MQNSDNEDMENEAYEDGQENKGIGEPSGRIQ